MPLHPVRLLRTRCAAGARLGILAASLLSPASLQAQAPVAPARFERGAVVSECGLASEAGAAILRKGGNAVDAAVAVAFALAVTYPEAGNIGGGGFLLARLADGTVTAFDFREKAPLRASASMFAGEDGKYDPARHHWSALAVGVPGTAWGLHLAHSRLGKLPWRDLVEPAIELAEKGFPVQPGLAASLREVLPSLRKYPASLAQFSRDGKPLRAGEVLVQPDLARTLKRIRDRGAAGFYEGETAALLVAEMERQGGLISREDLERYRAVERRPVRGVYRGYEIFSMPPPSAGGIALIEMLNVLEGYPLAELGFHGARSSHLMIEAMRRAYADRARFLGDVDLVEVPAERLTGKEYAAAQRKGISLERASRSAPDHFEWPAEGRETTHLSVVDAARSAVALTTTLEQNYGSRIVVSGAGFLLNNEMGDFNPGTGLTTSDGLIGTAPNLVAPEKRMLSSMTPAIVVRDQRAVLVLGSPGGRTITNTVLEVIVNYIDHGMPVQEAIDAPRFHHQWLPDQVSAERWCFAPETRAALEAMGHSLEPGASALGSVMAIAIAAAHREGEPDATLLEAGVDRRRPGAGAAGD